MSRAHAPRRRRVLKPWLALGALLLAFAGCSPPEEVASPATLVVGATAQPSTLDPTATDAVAGTQALLYNVYETLIKFDANGDLIPLLAQSWDVSQDRLTYTFKLNRSASFSDGAPVTAQDVVANIERIQTSPLAPKLVRAMSVVADARAVDKTTVEVHLSRPSERWLGDMAGAAGIVMNPTGFDTVDSHTAGSGPYSLAQWRPGDSLVLDRNESYWGTPRHFDTVTFQYFSDPNAMNAAMLAGDLDIISNLQAPETLEQFLHDSRFKILEGTTDAEVTLAINNGGEPTSEDIPQGTGNPALRDERVRKALTLAIDRKALLTLAWSGKGSLIGSMVVPTDTFYEDLSDLYPYDPQSARTLLAEAGYSNLSLRLRPAALPYAVKAAQVVESQLREVGVQVTVEEMSFPDPWVSTVIGRADYDLAIVAHAEPLDIFTFANPDYYWRYHNETVIDVIKRADEGTPEEYNEGLKHAARLIADDAAAIWLFTLPNIIVTESGVEGVAANGNKSQSFDITNVTKA